MDKPFLPTVVAVAALLFVLCSSCAEVDSTPQGSEPSTASDRGTIDPAAARHAWETAQASVDVRVTPHLPEVEWDLSSATEKIRRGSTINASHVIGNAVVLLINDAGKICTAQVINSWFLLTAAHCARDMLPNGPSPLLIGYTTTAGPAIVHVANVGAAIDPNYSAGDRDEDVALLLLYAPMSTCHGTLSACSPNTPNNAMFQFFLPNEPRFTRTSYAIVGYGDDDAFNPNPTALRAGTMTMTQSDFSDGINGYRTIVSWSSDSKSRPCSGDSGGPLVTTGFDRLLHLGVLSGGSNITSCNQSSGSVSYSGLSQTQYNWVMGLILAARDLLALRFDCAAMTHAAGGLYTFHCDNDGSLY